MDDEPITADDLRRIARALDLVPVPEHLIPRVLKAVQDQRAAARRFEQSGIDVRDVVTSGPYRV